MRAPSRADGGASRVPAAEQGVSKLGKQPATISGEPISRVVGGVLGLTGFSTALFIGLVAGNPALVTLGRGIVCMLVCYLVGRVLGSMGGTAAGEFIEKYKSDRPAPEPPQQLVDLQDRRNRHREIVEEMGRAA
ncbi:MAG: hypothetical protein JJU44_06745 [Planctomycetes bacterium]|nr:hypothetical protein [Planctomycetota bacterium]